LLEDACWVGDLIVSVKPPESRECAQECGISAVCECPDALRLLISLPNDRHSFALCASEMATLSQLATLVQRDGHLPPYLQRVNFETRRLRLKGIPTGEVYKNANGNDVFRLVPSETRKRVL
jgi:hypothetical protein